MVKRIPWLPEEITFLEQKYPTKGVAYCMDALGRGKGSIRGKVERLGLKTVGSPGPKRRSHEQYVFDLSKAATDYTVIETYRGSSSAIKHRHNLCGHERKVMPKNILQGYGYGCPQCNHLRQSQGLAHIYFIYFEELNLYKVGITNNLKNRLKQFGFPAIVIRAHSFEERVQAWGEERRILSKYEHLSLNSGFLKSGNTETLLLDSKEVKEIHRIFDNF